jgi:MoxR-like ATPase
VRVTRVREKEAAPFCKQWLTFGAGPRASLALIMAAKARAALAGQVYVSCDDVAAVALPVLRHRIALNFAAQAEGVGAADVISRILGTVPKV